MAYRSVMGVEDCKILELYTARLGYYQKHIDPKCMSIRDLTYFQLHFQDNRKPFGEFRTIQRGKVILKYPSP
jgi:hypothetical protein